MNTMPIRTGWSRRRFLTEALEDSHTQFVVNGERILETDRAQRVAYEVRSFQLYFDFRPILDTIAEATRRHIREGTFGHQYRGHRDPLGDALRARERLEGSEEYDV